MAQPASQWDLTPQHATTDLGKRVPRVVAQVLAARGLNTTDKLRLFLDPPHSLPYSPLRLPGMDSALQRVYSAWNRARGWVFLVTSTWTG